MTDDAHAVLRLPPGASSEEIRRAYTELRQMYMSSATYGLLSAEEVGRHRDAVEQAYHALTDRDRTRRDRTPTPIHVDIPTPVPIRVERLTDSAETEEFEEFLEPAGTSEGDVPDDVELASEIASVLASSSLGEPGEEPDLVPVEREITADTPVTGDLLREVREAKGIDLRDISNRTKISVSQLRALETESFDKLPAPVYVRGFATIYARYLLMPDPAAAGRAFFERSRAHLEAKHD